MPNNYELKAKDNQDFYHPTSLKCEIVKTFITVYLSLGILHAKLSMKL